MGKVNNKDRALYSMTRDGVQKWYVRCAVYQQMKRFGPFSTKTLARKTYMRVKTMESLGVPIGPVAKDESKPVWQIAPVSQFQECLYFLQAGPEGMIKIGHSKQLAARLKTLHTMNGTALRFLGAIPGTRKDEKYFHDRFSEDRSHGEWFRLSQDLLRFLWDAGMKPTVADKVSRMMEASATMDIKPLPSRAPFTPSA